MYCEFVIACNGLCRGMTNYRIGTHRHRLCSNLKRCKV